MNPGANTCESNQQAAGRFLLQTPALPEFPPWLPSVMNWDKKAQAEVNTFLPRFLWVGDILSWQEKGNWDILVNPQCVSFQKWSWNEGLSDVLAIMLDKLHSVDAYSQPVRKAPKPHWCLPPNWSHSSLRRWLDGKEGLDNFGFPLIFSYNILFPWLLD